MHMNSSRSGTLLGSFFMLIGIGLILGGAWAAHYALSPFRPDAPDTTLLVTKGKSPQEITRQLVQAGVIGNGKNFQWFGKLTRQWKKIKTGEYLVSGRMSPQQLFAILTSGVSIQYPITIKEGANLYEVAKLIEEKGLVPATHFVEACKNPELMRTLGFSDPLPPSIEGFLFPDTYKLNRTLSANDMIRLMYKRFSSEWGPKEQERARDLGMTQHQIITLASIIEKETGAPEERPLISSVFHNRLKKKMRLQSDPTTIYGMWERYQGNIKRSDLSTYNPYNTYVIPSLPVGPIANPGSLAIQAALFPANSDFLFFVSQNDGRHRFTSNYNDHVNAVRKFQLDPKAREGKSWRDLKK